MILWVKPCCNGTRGSLQAHALAGIQIALLTSARGSSATIAGAVPASKSFTPAATLSRLWSPSSPEKLPLPVKPRNASCPGRLSPRRTRTPHARPNAHRNSSHHCDRGLHDDRFGQQLWVNTQATRQNCSRPGSFRADIRQVACGVRPQFLISKDLARNDPVLGPVEATGFFGSRKRRTSFRPLPKFAYNHSFAPDGCGGFPLRTVVFPLAVKPTRELPC